MMHGIQTNRGSMAAGSRSDEGESRWDSIDPATAWEPWEPAAGEWDLRAAAHLYRRAGFGATWRQLEQALQMQPADVVGDLIASAEGPGADGPGAEGGLDSAATMVAAGSDARRLAAWWLMEMAGSPQPLRERMTLFWHGHFATSAAKVTDGRTMLGQLRMLRERAMGPFAGLVEGISRDPAMLVWLDCRESHKAHPNENFARELLELFCLGLGQYTEQDIRELARCFTGSEVRFGQFRFNSFQHDGGVKEFLGSRGAFDREAAVQVVVNQPSTARFVAHKLLRFFVAEDLPVTSPLVDSLAERYRGTGMTGSQILRQILGSRLFFSPQARGARISSPVELAVGLMRSLRLETNALSLVETLGELGQMPLYPPSVKGWNGGTSWINAQTLIGRMQLVQQLTSVPGQRVQLDIPDGGGTKPDLVGQLEALLLPLPPPPELLERLRKLAAGGNGKRSDQAARVVTAMAALPEFHLH